MFKFTLKHTALGSLQINEPEGWKTILFRLKRNTEEGFHSIWETFDGSFIFYGNNGRVNGGLDLIRQVIDEFGPDATLEFKVEQTVNGFSFFDVFTGLLALDGIQEYENNTALIPIIPNDFRTKFKNRYDTPVNIQTETSLDNDALTPISDVNLYLISQKVRRVNDMEVDFIESNSFTSIPNGSYMQIGYGKVILEELDETYNLPSDINPVEPVSNLEPEYGGEYAFEINVVSYVLRTITSPGLQFIFQSVKTFDGDYIDYYLNIDGVEFPFTWSDVSVPPGIPTVPPGAWQGGDVTHFTYTGTHTLKPGSSVKFYGRMNIAYTPAPGPDDFVFFHNMNVSLSTSVVLKSDVLITADTVYQDTEAEAFLIHDAAGGIVDRITGKEMGFYSQYLGSANTTYRQYDADGCHWAKVLVKGLQIRQYLLSDKPFFLSFKQWWEGINPILNLGLGYEKIDDEDVIRVEEKAHFYNPEVVLNISSVREITRTYDQQVMIKTFRNGYKQWQSDNISGIDDAQTKHTRASRFQKTGIDLVMESEFIAASTAIETTRRTTKKKSADYKYDDDTFIISVNPNETSPDNTYEPARDENYEVVNNILNAETRYNFDITPARNFMRWAPWLFGGLQHYVGSFFKFVSGEGNYDLETERSVSDGCGEYDALLSEKQDIEVTDDYYHRPELYKIVTKLEIEDYLTIKNNPKNAIGISQTEGGHKPFFIKDLEYNRLESEVTIAAWPVSYFEIQVIGSDPTDFVCEPSDIDECEDAYLTELSEELITESGDCLVLQ
jgi:hypothetical protein